MSLAFDAEGTRGWWSEFEGSPDAFVGIMADCDFEVFNGHSSFDLRFAKFHCTGELGHSLGQY